VAAVPGTKIPRDLNRYLETQSHPTNNNNNNNKGLRCHDMIYIPSFIQFGSGIQELITAIHRKDGDLIS
jgi:hypothetical protein